MSAAVLDLVQTETMDRQEVEALWHKKLPKVPIPNLGLHSLRRALAYELQVKQTGGLSRKASHALKAYFDPRSSEIANQGKWAQRERTSKRVLRPGATLVREWNGRRYVVEVVSDGFRLDGRTYGSLSQIAKMITGTHWSGPRFFGLVKAPTNNKRARA